MTEAVYDAITTYRNALVDAFTHYGALPQDRAKADAAWSALDAAIAAHVASERAAAVAEERARCVAVVQGRADMARLHANGSVSMYDEGRADGLRDTVTALTTPSPATPEGA